MSLFQNSVSFGTSSWEIGLKPDFPLTSKVAVPKSDILEQPHIAKSGSEFMRFLGYENII
jgi:hypothetical protein